MHHPSLLPILAAAALYAAPSVPVAAELGEPVVKSHIGQQLVADIELLPDEGGAVRASIAHDDVYRGANIARSPVIDTLNMSVMRRDGKQFLHITSLKPVDASYLHLFLELAENGKRKIRPATLWLQPEPVVAVPVVPKPVVAASPAPAPVVARVAAPVAAAPRTVPARPQPVPVKPDVACQALDYQNAQLSAQIVDLEEKVKALQYAIDMQGTRAPAKPRPVATKPSAAAVRPAADPGGMPLWPVFAGAGMLALGAGGGWWIRRRRRSSSTPAAAAVSEETGDA